MHLVKMVNCLEMIRQQRNKHFDGELLDLFLNNIDKILRYKHIIDIKSKHPTSEDVFTEFFNSPLNFIVEE